MIKKLLLLGYGFSAAAIAYHASRLHWNIVGTHRQIELYHDDLSVEKIIFNPQHKTNDSLKSHIYDSDYIVSSIPPSRDDYHDPAYMHLADMIKNSNIQRMIYLSTTGVYGNLDGAWCDETTSLQPTGKRGQARIDCEKQWQDLLQDRLTIMRLPGIYGPYRNVLTQVMKRTARRIFKKNQVFSRIHCNDVAQAVILSLQQDSHAEIYNICDDLSAPPQELVRYACTLLKQPIIPLIDYDKADLSTMAKSFYDDNKRVSNQKAKQQLSWYPFFCDYITGLHHIYRHKQYG